MDALAKQIPNAEARFEVIEEKLLQNEKDHARIEQKIDHNCQVAADNFTLINEKLDNIAASVNRVAWVSWFAKIVIAGIITATIGMIVFITQGHIKFK